MDSHEYIASLGAWSAVCRLDSQITQPLDKAAVLAAAVRLPVPAGVDVSELRTALVRPPFQQQARLFLVDVSRLQGPW